MNRRLGDLNSLEKEIFLGKETLSYLEKQLQDSQLNKQEISFCLNSYIAVLEEIDSLYLHGTGSYAFKQIVSSGVFSHDTKNYLTGEKATDPNATRG